MTTGAYQCGILRYMMRKHTNLTKLLARYKSGWVALDKNETKILAHADSFAAINDKMKDQDPHEIVLFPLGHMRSYFVGLRNG